MNDLEKFLALPNVDEIVEEVYVSKRLNDAFGPFKVKAMSQEEFKEYQRKASGKIGKKGMDFDAAKFNLAMVVGQTIEPNFNNAELLKKAGCVTAEQFIIRKLLSGEISELAKKIQEISGFDNEPEEDIEEAKN